MFSVLYFSSTFELLQKLNCFFSLMDDETQLDSIFINQYEIVVFLHQYSRWRLSMWIVETFQSRNFQQVFLREIQQFGELNMWSLCTLGNFTSYYEMATLSQYSKNDFIFNLHTIINLHFLLLQSFIMNLHLHLSFRFLL